MSFSAGRLRAAAFSLAVGASLVLAPVADAAQSGSTGFHGGGAGGFHGGFPGGGLHGGGGFRAGGIPAAERGFRNGTIDRAVQHRGWDRGWHRYGHWENGAWIGIWPDYDSDPYDAYWSYYCDPASPYFDPDDCSGY
ncbi:MAG TPA: hypothetical protein VKR31_05485 [Rhizomicrobium sp.]|nr:hypothetical protein [Rhizomicrobium sp.]